MNDTNSNDNNKKRSASDDDVVDLTNKNDDDDDDDKETQRPAKRPSRNAAASTISTAVPPMRPRLDPFHDTSDTEKRECVMYLCCDEGTNSTSFLAGLQMCKDNCSPNVHKHCFQMDGTRHITMWSGFLDNNQVASIQQVCDTSHVASKMMPVTIDFEKGFNSWKAGNYIGLSPTSTKTLKDILESIESENFSLHSGKISCDHLSLYRKRGMWSATTQIQRVRAALANYKWGRLQGISLRVKELGGPYDECKVLAEAASTTATTAE